MIPLDPTSAQAMSVVVIFFIAVGVIRMLTDAESVIRKRMGTSFFVALCFFTFGATLLMAFVIGWFFLGVMS